MADPRPDSDETDHLLARAAAGDPSAVGNLLDRHRDQLRTFVAARLDPAVRARVDASDVVQDALADAARRLPEYLERRPMPFHLWVLKSAYERTLQARRTHRAGRRDVAREASALDASSLLLAESLAAPGPTPSAAVQVRETAQRVCRALDDLSEGDKEILVLRLVDRLQYDEVGVLLDIESQTARRRFGRALIRLRKALVAHGLKPEILHD